MRPAGTTDSPSTSSETSSGRARASSERAHPPPPRSLCRHDAIEVDACGNIYIAEFWTDSLYIIEPGQAARLLIDFGANGESYGHSLVWGSGIGPWSDHSAYVPLPYFGDLVMEIELGIPSKDFNGGSYTTVP